MKFKYNNKSFIPKSLSQNSELDSTSVFLYQQKGNVLFCEYSGGNVVRGHLIGIVDNTGHIDMRYHQVNKSGQIQTGICNSTPELNTNGKIILHEQWQWTSGDKSRGTSTLIEI